MFEGWLLGKFWIGDQHVYVCIYFYIYSKFIYIIYIYMYHVYINIHYGSSQNIIIEICFWRLNTSV